MRILSLTAQKPDSTGSGVYLTELVRTFAKLGHSQAVLCGTADGDTIIFPEGVQVFPVTYGTEALPFPVCGMSDEMPYESTRYRDLTQKMTRQLFAAFSSKIRQAVEEFQPDVVLCHHLYFLAALVRELYPALPVYVLCHGSDLRQIRKNPWQRVYITEHIKAISGIFALHEAQKQMICSTYGVAEDSITVLGTGYNSDIFFREEQSREDRPLRLLFAGKISGKKGVFSLLRALDHLPEDTEVYLAGGAGNAEEFAAIQASAQSAPCKVVFLGKLDHRQLAKEMNRCHIFVLPSFYEGLPLVLMEAMACGMQAVCTDLPGIKAWLDKSVPGHRVQFVAPPAMRNEDEPIPETLPAFEHRLAEAIEAAGALPPVPLDLVKHVSWEALGRRITKIWNNET